MQQSLIHRQTHNLLLFVLLKVSKKKIKCFFLHFFVVVILIEPRLVSFSSGLCGKILNITYITLSLCVFSHRLRRRPWRSCLSWFPASTRSCWAPPFASCSTSPSTPRCGATWSRPDSFQNSRHYSVIPHNSSWLSCVFTAVVVINRCGFSGLVLLLLTSLTSWRC